MNTPATELATLLAVPNISAAAAQRIPALHGLLDTHHDQDHGRSVLTIGCSPQLCIDELMVLARWAVEHLDIRTHHGVHPRVGVVDVLPLVPFRASTSEALAAAGQIAGRIENELEVPVHLYGQADPGGRSLPELRRYLRSTPHETHQTAGVICVGVRGPLIAFNLNFRGQIDTARRVAGEVRSSDVRALGFELPSRGLVQVSMNLIAPGRVGPKSAFERVLSAAHDLELVDCEVVGLVPHPNLGELEGLPLRAPVRSIEQALEEKGLL